MAKDNFGLVFVVIIVVGAFFFFSQGDTTQEIISTFNPDLLLAKDNPLPITPSLVKNAQRGELIKVTEFPKLPLQSFVQPSNLFTVADPTGSGDWCFTEECNFQCSGSFDFCDGFFDEKFPPIEEGTTCPNDWVLVNDDKNCCPSGEPFYKAGFCFLEQKQDYPTSTGCPNSICTDGGSVLYNPIGFDPTLNCRNKFGESPTGDYWVDPNSACCFEGRTNFEKGTSAGTFGSNPLGITCSDQSSEGITCSQLGVTATCYQIDQCPSESLQCIDTVRFQTCEEVGNELLEGVNIASFNKFSSLSACSVGTICKGNACIPEPQCSANEVKLSDGSCRVLKQTCIDNNLNNICDPDDPVVWADPDNDIPICADRDGDKVCDGVESLFCKDSNKNLICDSDEAKWLITHCEDINGNGICDGIENDRTDCSLEFNPVCDTSTDITYPSQCFADAFDVVDTTTGACDIEPTIIRRDCASGDVPIPAGYICDFETGWLFKKETIYQDVLIDCRTASPLEGFTCQQVGEDWVWTRTELVEIDCFSLGCPQANQICQAGICLESQARCPAELNCQDKFGSDAVCDEELGLCVAKQFFPTIPPPPDDGEGLDVDSSTVLIIIGIAVGGFILLRLL